ncbi:MAG: hypothetical protein MJ252_02950 [archaeon]|nr:hypothetical protein [archaeon]
MSYQGKIDPYALEFGKSLNINQSQKGINKNYPKTSYTLGPRHSEEITFPTEPDTKVSYNPNYNRSQRNSYVSTKSIQRQPNVNWNWILNINPNDINALNSNKDFLLNLNLTSNDLANLPDSFSLHLINIYRNLATYSVLEKEKLKKETEETQNLEQKLNEKRNKIKLLKNENEELKKINRVYKRLLEDKKKEPESSESSFAEGADKATGGKGFYCIYCTKKRFKSQKYLEEHYKRRHLMNYIPYEEEYKEDKDIERKVDDMRKLFDSRLINFQYANGLGTISNQLKNLRSIRDTGMMPPPQNYYYPMYPPERPKVEKVRRNRNISRSPVNKRSTSVPRNHSQPLQGFDYFDRNEFNKRIQLSADQQRQASSSHSTKISINLRNAQNKNRRLKEKLRKSGKNPANYQINSKTININPSGNNPIVEEYSHEGDETYVIPGKQTYDQTNNKELNQLNTGLKAKQYKTANNVFNYDGQSSGTLNLSKESSLFVKTGNPLYDFYIQYQKRDSVLPQNYRRYKCLCPGNFAYSVRSKVNSEIQNRINQQMFSDSNNEKVSLDSLERFPKEQLIKYVNQIYFNYGNDAKEDKTFGYYCDKVGNYLKLTESLKEENDKINLMDNIHRETLSSSAFN